MTKAKITPTTGGGLLSATAILSAADLPHEDVAVPEWGGTVRIRTMTSGARDDYEQKMLAAKGQTQRNVRAQLVVLCAVDEAGGRLFGPSDIEALGRKSAKALDRLFDVAIRLNGMGPADIEELEKN